MFELKGRTAVVTGAGSGIGRAIALVLAERGAHVWVLDLSESAAHETRELMHARGHAASSVVCDVSDASSVERAFSTIDQKSPKLDILVNNAGIGHVGALLEVDEDTFDRLMRVNVKGVYLCARAGVERMARSGGGAIVNMASIASLIGVEDRFAYSATKGAVLTMTRAIAVDYMKAGIRCNCICPARIHTPFVDGFLAKHYPGKEAEKFAELSRYQPMGRMGTPEEVAALTLYLCSDEAAFITGQALPLDGGVLVK
jgi:NAD(P)-dependent dehydrogenase (short-subunit alcohol dehydrogenase family)